MKKANNINIINAVRNLSYNSRIPKASAENIKDVQNEILNYEVIRNEFISALIGRIALTSINGAFFKNPLKMLASEPMRFGSTEQEIFVNMVKARVFNEFAGVDELYQYYDSNVMAAYHKINKPLQYAITITYDNLRNAFQDEFGLRSLINAKVEAVYSSAEYDEYLIMKSLVENAYKSGKVAIETIENPADLDTAKAMTIKMKEIITKMQFPNPDYNIAGAHSAATKDSIFYMVTPDVDARLDVDVLAYAFNMNKADIDVRKIVVDKFADEKIKAVVFDMRWFKVRENFRTMSDSKNGAALTWNYFYTISQMYSNSPFFPMVVLTTETATPTDITAENITDVEKDTIIEINAKTSGSGYISSLYDYELSGNTSAFTYFIPGTNRLKIANDEKGSLEVKIILRSNPAITKTITVTLKGV